MYYCHRWLFVRPVARLMNATTKENAMPMVYIYSLLNLPELQYECIIHSTQQRHPFLRSLLLPWIYHSPWLCMSTTHYIQEARLSPGSLTAGCCLSGRIFPQLIFQTVGSTPQLLIKVLKCLVEIWTEDRMRITNTFFVSSYSVAMHHIWKITPPSKDWT